MTAAQVKAELAKHGNADDAVFLQRFFKTGPGQYGEGDQFIGVRVPAMRRISKEFKDLPLTEVQKLLDSPIHEHRLAAVVILSYKYPKTSEDDKRAIYDLYIKNVYEGRINNWDIVDVTAPHIIGAHLEKRPRDELYKLARSNDIWQKRVAIISTFRFIKKGDPSTSLDMAEILLHDKHDLIHKAVGWVLREVGKSVDEKLLTDFLDRHAHDMPRMALRYSLEKLTPEQKTHYMKLKAS
jgi:3-methyladenine DNA glycosylase AlkD